MFLLSLLLLPSASQVHGHANLISSDPPQGSILPTSPTHVCLRFTEELEKEASTIAVLDSSGNQVNSEGTILTGDGKGMCAPLPVLKEGVYTVSWKAVSAVDGHLTRGAFPFGIGNVSQTFISGVQVPESSSPPSLSNIILRWVSYAAQTALAGSVAFMLLVWRPATRFVHVARADKERVSAAFSRSLWVYFALTAASTLLWLAFQSSTLGGSSSLQRVLLETRFGSIWILRVSLLIPLGTVLWLRLRRGSDLLWILLPMASALLLTTSLYSHNANLGLLPIISDWAHLMGVAVWVGGLLQLTLIMLSAHRNGDAMEMRRLLLILIPRFSIVAVASLALIGVTGLVSAYLQLRSLDALYTSPYGNTLVVKLLLILPMVLLGAVNQFKIHQTLLKQPLSRATKWFERSVRTEAILGIVVLLAAAILTNIPPPSSSPPASSSPPGLRFSGINEGVKVELRILPGNVGINEFSVSLSDQQGNKIDDVVAVDLEFTPANASMGPSRVRAKQTDTGSYLVVGGFLAMPGEWKVTVHVTRQRAYDAIVDFSVNIRSSQDSKRVMREFYLRTISIRDASPYDIKVDDRGYVWFTIPGRGSIGRFDPRTQTFHEYPVREPGTTPYMLAVGRNGTLWFTDPGGNRVFSFHYTTGSFRSHRIPTIQSVPGPIVVSDDGKVWFAEILGNKIASLDPVTGDITEYTLPTLSALPQGLAVGRDQSLWFTMSRVGKIGRLDMKSGNITEYSPPGGLNSPVGIAVDGQGLVWFAQHGSNKISAFDPSNGSFRDYQVKGFPYGVAVDAEGNIWFVQHVGNAIGVLFRNNYTVKDYRIPTPDSNTQWLAIDSSGNVWFAESAGNAIGVLGTVQGEVEVFRADPYFTNAFIVSTVALIGLAVVVGNLAQRRLRYSIKLAGRAGGP